MIQHKFLIATFCLFFSLISNGQDGPGGIGNTTGNSNLQLWLKSSDLLVDHADGDPILQWLDKSGAANNVITSIDFAPIFRNAVDSSSSSVEFAGNQFLQTPALSSSFSNPESTIFVLKEGGSFSGTIISIANNGWVDEMLLFNDEQYHHSSSGNFTKLAHQCLEGIPEKENSIICGVFGRVSDELSFWVNGIESSEPIETASNPKNYSTIDRKVTIGQRDQFVSQEYLKGKIIEIIVYNTKLSDEDIESVEKYLNCGNEELPLTTCYDLTPEECPIIASTLLPADLEKNISLAPNPSSDFIYLNIEGQPNLRDSDYAIYNSVGQVVFSDRTMSSRNEINVSSFPTGIYFLKLELEDGFYTLKFLKD